MSDLPSRARAVIVGGGVVGCSVAHHLTKLGWSDVLLLEQGRLSSGTTWHAAGLVGPLRASEQGTKLVAYSADLYASLEAETGLATGYRNTGGLVLARTPDRLMQLQRTAANGVACGLEAELISPQRAQELWPPMQVEDLLGALWLPGDGKVNPADLTQSLARGARTGGARIVEKVRVTGFSVDREGPHPRVTGVHTDLGDVEAEVVVLCAGQWTRALAHPLGVVVPLHSAEHFYVVTEAVEGTHPDLPIMRDQDGWTYFKEEVGGLVVGGFEPNAKPWVAPDEIPYPFEFQLLEEDWEHFGILMEQALLRVPSLEHTGIRKFYNGPESFTPDNQFLLGETPEVDGLFVGAGMNSVGIASAGGAGKALAEWIVGGGPQEDLVGVDIRRFGPWQDSVSFLRDRVVETLGVHYEIPWPNRELLSGRPQRTSPLHQHLVAGGALLGTRNGWERPLVFGPEALDYTWGKPAWLSACIEEQLETRTKGCVFDETSFSKYVVSGPGALAGLQWICAGDVDVAIGRTIYTPWLNSRGGYEADVTVTRLGEDEFFVVSSAATTYRDLDWLRRHVAGAGVEIRDVTDDYAVLGVFGPKADAAIPRGEWGPPGGTIEIRSVYVDPTGVELFIPTRLAHRFYDELPLRDAGYYAIEACRLELGRRAFGRELGPDVLPAEAGLAWALSKEKDFLGRAALETAQPRRRLVSLVCEDPEVMLWGGELLSRGGDPVGQVTSAAWGATVGAAVGLAWVRRWPVTADWLGQGGFTVDVGGVAVPVRLSLRAPIG